MFCRGWRVAVCAASGPSLSEEQCAIVARAREEGRCHVIAVNDAWRLLPDADILYACDLAWWKVYIEAVRARFSGELWTQNSEASVAYGLNWVRAVKGSGVHEDPDTIYTGGSSGYQALMLATLFRSFVFPLRVPLIGYDYQRTGGRAHFFGDHPPGLGQGRPESWRPHFDLAAPTLKRMGIEVINCSAATALTCFPRMPIDEALVLQTT